MKKFASLLLSCIYLVSSSNSMDNLNSINDLSNTDNNINTITMSNIQPNNNIINFEEDQKEENNQEVNNENTINNNQNNTNTKKKKKKKHRKKRNKNNKNDIKEHQNIYECNEKKLINSPSVQSIKNKINIKDINEENMQDAKDYLDQELQQIYEKNEKAGVEGVEQAIQDVFNIDIVKSTIDAMNNDINQQIHSKKFKMLGDLHKQIMNNSDNGNTVYNRFDIDTNILDKYKKYYKKLLDCINDFLNKKLADIISLNYDCKVEIIQSIIHNIYKELKEEKKLTDIDDIISFFIEEQINSEQDLQRNNIFKIIGNLASVINDCTSNARIACIKLAFGPKLVVGKNVILDNSNFIEALRQFDTISQTFGFYINK